jgi:hypothetical protein
MPDTQETTIEQVNTLTGRQNDILEQLRHMLPAEYAGNGADSPRQDSLGFTWHSAIESLEDAVEALDDLAATLFYG